MQTNCKEIGFISVMITQKKILSKIFLLGLLLCIYGCSNNRMSNPMADVYELPENCDFNSVGNNSELRSDCSPKLIDQFPKANYQGILINSAPDILWPKNFGLKDMPMLPNGNADGPLKFMIAGLVNLPYNTLNLHGDFASQVVIVAVNQKTAKVYNGKMIPFGFAGVKPDVTGLGISQINNDHLCYFNIDLVQNLEIPIADATYNVYAVLGDYKSNVLTVKTKVK
jgi:hypothetical protein